MGSQRKGPAGRFANGPWWRSAGTGHFIESPTLKPQDPPLPKRHGQVEGDVVLVVAHHAQELKLELEQRLRLEKRRRGEGERGCEKNHKAGPGPD